MEPGIYVSVSGQIALQRRLDTIAHNVANSGTPGFRAENVSFETIVSRGSVSYATRGNATFSQATGQLTETGSMFDVALQGGAFLAIGTPGGTVYSRDGRLRVAATGDLVNIEGNPVLDSGGGPIQIDMSRGPIVINRSGLISQRGERAATLGLFGLPADAQISRGQASALVWDKPGVPVTDFVSNGVVQGYLEGANVNPILEMSRLIAVSRAFDTASAALDQSDRKLNDAIRTLGSGTGK